MSKYKSFLAKPWPSSLLLGVVPYFAWNSSLNVNCEPSGPVLCSQLTSRIIPVVRPVVYSEMSLVELVRGAVSSTQQQNTAAHLQDDYRLPSPRPVHRVRSSPQPDLPTLDRLHGEEEERRRGKAGIANNFPLLLKASFQVRN